MKYFVYLSLLNVDTICILTNYTVLSLSAESLFGVWVFFFFCCFNGYVWVGPWFYFSSRTVLVLNLHIGFLEFSFVEFKDRALPLLILSGQRLDMWGFYKVGTEMKEKMHSSQISSSLLLSIIECQGQGGHCSQWVCVYFASIWWRAVFFHFPVFFQVHGRKIKTRLWC